MALKRSDARVSNRGGGKKRKKKKRRMRNPCEQLDLSRIVSPRKPFRRRVGETRNERGIDGKIEGQRMDGKVEKTSRRVKMGGVGGGRNRKKENFAGVIEIAPSVSGESLNFASVLLYKKSYTVP